MSSKFYDGKAYSDEYNYRSYRIVRFNRRSDDRWSDVEEHWLDSWWFADDDNLEVRWRTGITHAARLTENEARLLLLKLKDSRPDNAGYVFDFQAVEVRFGWNAN